jgi:cytochrome c-type biogenesis protein CcmH/NrfG
MNEWWLLSVLIGLTLFAGGFIIYPLRRQVMMSILLVPLIFILAFTGYYHWGSFAKWQSYLSQQEKEKEFAKFAQSPYELIAKLRSRLDNTAKSAKGWYLLGRLYMRVDGQQNAADAFATAYKLKPAKEEYAVNYAHSLWQLHHRKFTAQVTELFENVLKNNPKQPDALMMLAIDAYERHVYEDAIGYWQRLLQLAPPQSEEASFIRKAIAKAEEHIKLREKNLD